MKKGSISVNTISPLEVIHHPLLQEKQIQLRIKRDDLLSLDEGNTFGGNKWRKMKYNLMHAREKGYDTILTFGGAYSNHIVATASAGRIFGFKTIGIIRGEEHLPLNSSLAYARQAGMKLHYISRTTYKLKNTAAFLSSLQDQFGAFYLIPEGGTNKLALQGCQELASELLAQCSKTPDFITVCCGTGGTMAGLVSAWPEASKIIGFPALKGNFMADEIIKCLDLLDMKSKSNWIINGDYHFGGYAKFKPGLVNFINTFFETHNIPLDPIYTGKMMFGLFDLIKKGFFPKGTDIVSIHTGGLQGIAGFNERHGNLIHYH
ncbi:MAG: pyridoxal-phosphate dependent enzyme [Bacteroidota bacterium]